MHTHSLGKKSGSLADKEGWRRTGGELEARGRKGFVRAVHFLEEGWGMLGNMTPPGVRGDKRLRGGKGKEPN